MVCAWSGGADSTALIALAQAAGCVVSAIHVDHGLRPESSADADHVRAMGAEMGVPVEVVTVQVADGPNLEARARDARRSVLPPDALLGHTADDQAETVLLHLLRGAGPAGLGAMSSDRRPLLALRRGDTQTLCVELGLSVLDDPSNADRRFRRNRVRHELVPLLTEVGERDPVPLLARAAGHQRELVDLLDELSADADPTDTRALQRLHPAVAAHVLRRWLRTATGSPYAVDADTLDRVLAVVRHEHRATEVGGGWRLERCDGRLRVGRSDPGS